MVEPEPPVVIAGASGMLGRAWQRRLDDEGRSYTAHGRETLDITDPASIERAIPRGTPVVVNCAAYTAVDDCEADEAAALRLNHDGVRNLAQRCADIGATLVHYSTDYVFPGDAVTPYPVDAPINPLNAYGRSKALGEAALRDVGGDYRLIRTSWLYAPWGQNFVTTIARLAEQRDALSVVNDQHGRPTSAEGLTQASWALVQRGTSKTYHVTDGGVCSWFDLATEIVRLSEAPCVVQPCGSGSFPRPANRPAYSVLDLSATEALLGPTPSWTRRLADVLHAIRADATPRVVTRPVTPGRPHAPSQPGVEVPR